MKARPSLTHVFKHTLFAVPFLVMASLILPSAGAGERQSGKPATGSAAVTTPGMAAGAAEDTLNACMARIPKDASAGQRMIAEQGCMRDEIERTQYLPSSGSAAADNQSHR
jgi:hypothetical protein